MDATDAAPAVAGQTEQLTSATQPSNWQLCCRGLVYLLGVGSSWVGGSCSGVCGPWLVTALLTGWCALYCLQTSRLMRLSKCRQGCMCAWVYQVRLPLSVLLGLWSKPLTAVWDGISVALPCVVLCLLVVLL